jgi:pimeloyl-ACP methyl ester carboxylesterase
MILLHGMLGSSRNWQTAGRDLAARRRVYALDLRNHGLSPHASDMSYESMASDVTSWMDRNGLGEAEIVGHSLGGKVGMVIACRSPRRVSRLVVIDIAPKAYKWPERKKEFEAMRELDPASLSSRAEAETRMEALVPSWPQRKFLTTNLERRPTGGFAWQIGLAEITAALPTLEGNPLGAGEAFPGPSLFILGGKSAYVRDSDRPAILRHFPGARIEVIAESGHNPHIEAREALVRLVSSS